MDPSLTTVCDVIDSLEQAGDGPVVIEVTSPSPVTYTRQELFDTVGRLAAGLIDAGIERGQVVAVLAENRFEWIAAALAVIRSGAIVLPIDTQVGDANLRHVLNHSGARLVFTNVEQAARVKSLGLKTPPRVVRLDSRDETSGWRGLLADTPANLPQAAPDDTAVLFYTSGTTGPPKGVPLTQANLFFQLRAIEQTQLVTPEDRLLLPLPLHHVYPFVIGVLIPPALKLPVILPKSLTGPEIMRAIGEARATVIVGVPRLFRALYSAIESRLSQQGAVSKLYFKTSTAVSSLLKRRLGLSAGKLLLRPLHRRFGPSLRLLASGGSALDPHLARRLEALGWDIGIGYGLTETSPLLTLNLPGSGALDSAGKAVPGVELKIGPADTPSSEAGPRAGEVLARGPNVFKGYWNDPEKSRETFTEDGWFRTGDLGYVDKRGFLFLQGRASTLIVTESGKNIQPDEVEEHYAAHPWIGEMGVFGDEGRLVAVVIADVEAVKRSGLDEAGALKTAITEQSKKLPSYQRLSDYAVSREALPRTRLGKIQRHRLPERYRHAKDEGEGRAAAKPGPIDPSEMSDQDRVLVEEPAARQVWQWLARRYPDIRLTPDTGLYLDLNIDSLEMINITMEVSRLTGVELDEQAIAGVETVRDLMQQVARQADAERGSGLDPERILTEPEAYLTDEQRRWLKPLGAVLAVLPRIGRLFIKGVLRVFFRLHIRGADKLPADRPFVLAANHVSVLDPPVLFAAVPPGRLRKTFFAGWTGMVFKTKLLRLIARLGQTVPIDPRRAAASSLALGAMVLKQGNNLIWFPEGERSWNGQLKPFKPGIGLLLKHYPVTVVPAYIHGAYEAMPRGRRWPRMRPITLTLGDPVDPEMLIDTGSDEPIQDQIGRGLQARLEKLIADNRP